jgi:hypothetical protein
MLPAGGGGGAVIGSKLALRVESVDTTIGTSVEKVRSSTAATRALYIEGNAR